MKKPYESLIGFEWDKWNKDKIWSKHKVSYEECEEAFFDYEKREFPDPRHSHEEERRVIVGKTKKGRILFIVYTLRNDSIRIISARDLNKRKEVNLYEKAD